MSRVGRSLVVALFLFLAVVAQVRSFHISLVATIAVALLFFLDRTHYPKRLTQRQIGVVLAIAAIVAVVVFVVEANHYAPAQVKRRP